MAQPLARILIVDDEVPQMQALCETLRVHGYEMVGVTCGDDALVALQDQHFDLVLTDLMMPVMDGITVLRRAMEIDPNLVCIIMTGAGTISTAVEAMKTGALDYILKPFKVSVILPVLSRALAVRQLRIENAELDRALNQRTAELETANTELGAANRELEAFSASVSHDLRAPLRAINGFSHILLEDHAAELSDDGRHLLDMMMTSAREMNQLIDDLLRLSRLGRHTLAKEKVDTLVLANRVIEDMRGETADREVELIVGELPECFGDKALIKQVFINLISNALKFTRKRERAVIEIGCDLLAGEKAYFVRDNGTGFDMERAEKLFGDFQRFHSQHEFEGTGVGLSIVRRIIERHGGRVWAKAEVDKGATFYLTIPE
jgi:two-component system sensor histidine kinase/response regulator